jgi:uncharacterized protein (DUF1501 family)
MAALTRRGLLQNGATMIAAGWAVPSFIAETARIVEQGGATASTANAAGRRILVLVQLQGGNDGMNTVIPYGDGNYYQKRPTLGIPQGSVLPLSGYVGLHPSLTRMKARYEASQMTVVQGVGYPNPSRSHFRGTDVWNSGVPERLEPKGWMGRYLQNCSCARADHLEALGVGSGSVSPAFWTEMSLVPAIASVSSFRYAAGDYANTSQRNAELAILNTALAQAEGTPEAEFLRQSMNTALTDSTIIANAASSFTPAGNYPANAFGNSMKLTAQLVGADVGTSIFHVSLGSFDTHISQLENQAQLLATLDQSLDAFMVDMERIGKANDVILMTFSEFGRRVAQNTSSGTDHGTAAPMIILGGGVKKELFGTYPSLTDLDNGDLKATVDFRSVYATILQDWLGMSAATSTTVLGGNYSTLGILKGTTPRSGNGIQPPGPTPTPAPAPTLCAPRPKIGVTTAASGGQLQVTINAGAGVIRSVQIGPTNNAIVDIEGRTDIQGTVTHTLATPASRVTLMVRRATAGVAANVPLVVTDDCGPWQTFVGGGPSAF